MTTDPGAVRHLVLTLNHPGAVETACSERREPFDRKHHTVLAACATCPDCLAVQAARVIVIDAGEHTQDPGD